jgi:type I restriction enzyme S subunit
MVGKLDHEVIEKFKEFQEKTGKYSELYIEDVEFENKELGSLINIFDNQRIALSANERNKRKGQYPYYGASGIIDYIDDYIYDGKYLIVSEDGENLRARKTPIAFFANGKFWVNNHAHIIRGKKNLLDDKYLKYFIDSNKLYNYISFSAQPKLSQTNLKKILIPIPKDLNKFYSSYKIQEAIVEFLEYSFDMIEQIRKNVDRKYELYERLNKALIPSVFIKDYVKVAFGRYAKEHGIGFDITDIEFTIKRIHSDSPEEVVCKKRMGFTPKTSANGDINWFRVEDLNSIKGLYIEKPNTIKKTTIDNVIAKNGKTSSKNTPIQKGDILVSFLATPGIVKIYDSDEVSYCNQAIDILTPNKNIDKRYLAYNCMVEYPKYGKKQTMGTNLDNSEKMKIEIYIPKDLENYTSIEIQKIIADFIEYTENRIQKEFDKMDKVYDALNRLHKTYLARTFSLIQWGVKQ